MKFCTHIVHIDLSDLEEIWRTLTSVKCLSFLGLDVGEFQMHHQFVSFQGKGSDNSCGVKEGTHVPVSLNMSEIIGSSKYAQSDFCTKMKTLHERASFLRRGYRTIYSQNTGIA